MRGIAAEIDRGRHREGLTGRDRETETEIEGGRQTQGERRAGRVWDGGCVVQLHGRGHGGTPTHVGRDLRRLQQEKRRAAACHHQRCAEKGAETEREKRWRPRDEGGGAWRHGPTYERSVRVSDVGKKSTRRRDAWTSSCSKDGWFARDTNVVCMQACACDERRYQEKTLTGRVGTKNHATYDAYDRKRQVVQRMRSRERKPVLVWTSRR